MNQDIQFEDAYKFAAHLRVLHGNRRSQKLTIRSQKPKRRSLTYSERKAVFTKTGGRCHVCGSKIDEKEPWDADHVFAFAQGGLGAIDNYLPAHSICNGYRWFYGAEEFQWILKLGVWFRTQIEHENILALKLKNLFVTRGVASLGASASRAGNTA